jgi:hypothetical protein
MKPKDVSSGNYYGKKFFELLPKRHQIPEEFDWTKADKSEWVEIVERWFFKGLPEGTKVIPKEGIDTTKAVAHLSYVMRSFEPKHEHKIEGVAYLMSQWFEKILIPQDKENDHAS